MPIENKATILNLLVDALTLLKKGRYTLARETLEKATKEVESL